MSVREDMKEIRTERKLVRMIKLGRNLRKNGAGWALGPRSTPAHPTTQPTRALGLVHARKEKRKQGRERAVGDRRKVRKDTGKKAGVNNSCLGLLKRDRIDLQSTMIF